MSNVDDEGENRGQEDDWGPCQKCLVHVLDKPILRDGVFALQNGEKIQKSTQRDNLISVMVQNLSQASDDTDLEGRTFGIRFFQKDKVDLATCKVCSRCFAAFYNVKTKRSINKYWNRAKEIFKTTTNGESIAISTMLKNLCCPRLEGPGVVM